MRLLESIDREAIAGLLARDEYFWLDLTDPSEDEVTALGEVFSFHPLALEDMRKRDQRPKLDDFGDYMFLVYYGAGEGEGGEIELEEVHAFLSGGYIVTAHQGACAALEEAHERLEAQTPRSDSSSSTASWTASPTPSSRSSTASTTAWSASTAKYSTGRSRASSRKSSP